MAESRQLRQPGAGAPRPLRSAAIPTTAPAVPLLAEGGHTMEPDAQPLALAPQTLRRLQPLVGNAEVARLVDGLRDITPAEGLLQRAKNNGGKQKKGGGKQKLAVGMKAGKPKGKKGGARKPSLAGLRRGRKAVHKKKGWVSGTKHTSSGMWTEQVTVRAPHSFADERVRQVLRHLSTAIFHYVKSQLKEEQEVQALYVNNRVLVSSNLPGSMALLKGLTSKQVFEIFLSDTYVGKDDRGKRDITKLRALIKDSKSVVELTDDLDEMTALLKMRELLISAIADPKSYLGHCTLDNATSFIADDQHAQKLIVVEGLSPVHAEQNLIIAYHKSGVKDVGYIYGKKRPCTGCLMTFVFAVKILGCNLVYNDRPGGFWGPAEPGLLKLMQLKADLTLEEVDDFVDKNIPDATFRTGEADLEDDEEREATDNKNVVTNYDSDSGSDRDDGKLELGDVEDAFKALTKKKKQGGHPKKKKK